MAKYKQFRVFGQRNCTYCGSAEMYYIDFFGNPLGVCDCGNTDYCDHETETDVKKRFGDRMKAPNISTLEMLDE